MFDVADVSAGRLNLLHGAYWGSTGLLVVVVALLGAFPDGRRPAIYVVGVGAFAVGAILAWPRTPELPHAGHVALSAVGGLTIAFGAMVAGPTHRPLAGLLAVYVTSFALIAARQSAPVIVPISAAAHLAVLLAVSAQGGWGLWLATWGVALVVGWIAGEVVEAHRQALAEQERLLAELCQADTAKTALLHAVGHELTRPMTTMLGLSETLLERGDELPQASRRDLLRRIVAGTIQLRTILDELLGLTRMASGRVELDLEHLPFREVIEVALDRSGVGHDELEVSMPDDLDVVVDRGRLAHAIANLLTNAKRYGAHSPIRLDVAASDGDVEVRVSDHGPGVPDDAKAAVFEPFVRASADHVAGGSGLGLSLVRQFVRLHGGEAWVEDHPEGGAVAVLRFPRVAPQMATGPEASGRG